MDPGAVATPPEDPESTPYSFWPRMCWAGTGSEVQAGVQSLLSRAMKGKVPQSSVIERS